MKDRERRIRRMLYDVQRYVEFFLLVAFVVTCCMMLFISTMQRAMDISFTEENIQAAAKITFANVVLISTAFTVIDGIRRKAMVERPVREIVQAARKLMQGDFSVRIPMRRSIDSMDGFHTIAECFNLLAEELSGTETLRTDFIANVSHELKTPLAVMQNYAVMLQQPHLPEEARVEYARAVAEACRGLAGLITDILRLNKLENQQILLNCSSFDLGEQLCECLLGFEEAWEEKGLEIETEIEQDVIVEGDAQLLSIVWNNLFSNAVKFTAPGGRISLKLAADGEEAVVQLSDTGCGFGSDVGRHIFEKFYQGDSSHATKGNGLGLALVKRVVDLVGGDIAVDSEVGKGSCFTVRIRRKMDAQA